jgi:hypothetical protein
MRGAGALEAFLRRILPAPLPPPRRLPLWALGALVVVLTALQMVRRPDPPPLWDSFYTEDGKIFFSQALNGHFLNTLAASYFGYLHTVPRTIAMMATWVRLEDAPLVMSLLTTAVVALASVYVLEASGAWIASPLLRGVLALAVGFAPVTAREISGSVANVHYALVFAAFWAVICPWRTRGWLVASTTIVAAAVLSNPLCAVMLPIPVAFAIRDRDRRAWVIPAVIVAGLALQLLLRDESATSFGGSRWETLPRIFAERVTSSILVGDRYLEDVFGGRAGSPFAWGSLVLIAAAVAFGLWRLRGRRQWLLAGGALLSVAFFLISALSRGTLSFFPSKPWLLGSTRYIYLPVLFLMAGLIVAVDRASPGGRRFPARELAVGGLVLATIVAGYRAPHRTAGGPRWKPALAQARSACAAGRPLGIITLYGRGPTLTAVVPIDPPKGWYVPVPCEKLL